MMGPTIYLNAESPVFAQGGVIEGGDVEVPTLRHYEGKMTFVADNGGLIIGFKRLARKYRRQLRATKRAQRLDHRETDYGRAILAGLQHGKHVYQGTVTDKRAGRRAANRRAKASRKANRT